MKEIWKDVIGYEGLYQVSNRGRVKSLERLSTNGRCLKGKILKTYKRNGYNRISLSKNGKNNWFSTHRLVAESFLNKLDFKSLLDEDRSKIDLNKLEVNHIDENKSNNNIDNLEWCTSKYNNNYGNHKQNVIDKIKKKVSQYDLNGNFIKMYDSINDASFDSNLTHHIGEVCQGKRKTAGGYIWKYV